MKTAVMFGAGNIGRGFIGMLLAQAGYKVIFGDVNPAIIDRLAQDKKYTVHILDVNKKDYVIENVDGIMSNGPEIVDALAEASIVTTAVGLVILPRIAGTFADGIKARKANGSTEYMNIIACENAIRASSQLKEHVYKLLNDEEKAYADQYVGFPDCSVDRIVPPVRNEIPTDVVVEEYYEWHVEKASFKGEVPEIEGMDPAENLDAYIERKLFTLNTGHCITAYIGYQKGLGTIKEAIEDPEIYAVVEAAMQQSGAGLVKKYNFDPEAHAAYIKKIISRFKNPYLKDDCTRVGREPLRKMAPTDRLTKPVTTALSYGLPVDKLLQGVGAALRYDNPEDKQSVEMQQMIAEKGVVEAYKEISGITDEAVIAQVKAAYDSFA
ncbi:MAG TPA: mannitol-1-phosphate 5-dehydrogenase [Lachnospiraceae bacterium]|nr:mannitol-1-phosphate 5-dehydrogenase [Lachnospiraceae bacterium]